MEPTGVGPAISQVYVRAVYQLTYGPKFYVRKRCLAPPRWIWSPPTGPLEGPDSEVEAVWPRSCLHHARGNLFCRSFMIFENWLHRQPGTANTNAHSALTVSC